MNIEQVKSLSIKVMIGSLIAAAGIAVVAVLVGSFNDVLSKALFTLFLITVHALASLGFVGVATGKDDSKLNIFNNTVFVIIVLSFITSIFGAWEVLPSEIVAKLYGTYFIGLFASLHGDLLFKVMGKENKIDLTVYINYFFMAIVILLLLPLVWLSNTTFPDFYFRMLAASGIVDATLTILAVIWHKLYIQKHPEENSQLFRITEMRKDENGNLVEVSVNKREKRRIHPLLWLLGVYLAFQILASLVFAIFGGL